jgi:hypothetical protein
MIPLSIPEISVVIVYNDGASSLGALTALAINQVIGVHDPDDIAGLILGATVTLAGYARQDPGLIRILTRLGTIGCGPWSPHPGPAIPHTASDGSSQAGETGQPAGRPARRVRRCSPLVSGHRSCSGDR